jgi:hypothetical protein
LFDREEIMAGGLASSGDRNTSFFQARATTRRRINKIKYLLREDGSKCEDQTEIKRMTHTFYKELFTSEPHEEANSVLASISTLLYQTINDYLCRPYSNKEIKEALFQMGPTKEHGFPVMFYQKQWDISENDVCNAVSAFGIRTSRMDTITFS